MGLYRWGKTADFYQEVHYIDGDRVPRTTFRKVPGAPELQLPVVTFLWHE